jgi:hypothetical protein
MNLNKTRTLSAVVGALLAFGAAGSLSGAAQAQPMFPEEPTRGSIRVSGNEDEGSLASRATLARAQAVQVATGVAPGKIIESELEVENQFLVWEVKSVSNAGQPTALYIDAGNGEVLAMEREDEDYKDKDGEDEEEAEERE